MKQKLTAEFKNVTVKNLRTFAFWWFLCPGEYGRAARARG